jgi:entericidin B
MFERALAVVVLMGILAGCNTIQGAGKDLERGGEKVQDAAKDTKQNM